MTKPELAKRSCGTCRDRRVLCDRTTPTCLQCARTKRKCRGYGLRLSWPSQGDTRRAVVGKSPVQKSEARAFSNARLVHMFSWNVEMYYSMTKASCNGDIAFILPILHIPLPWDPSTFEVGDEHLLQYFQCVASQSLTTFGHDPARLGNVLLRAALASNTESATAVLRSLLALSSLHCYGVCPQAFNQKISGLKALAVASRSTMGEAEIIQHIAAGMLLLSFEVYQASCTSSQWTWYIAGVKELFNSLPESNRDMDVSLLMDWVYYHDVLAHFTLRHWRGGVTPLEGTACRMLTGPTEVSPKVLPGGPWFLPHKRVSEADQASMIILRLLSEVCNTVVVHPHAAMLEQELDDYIGFLRVLDWRIRSIELRHKDRETATGMELYQLATLIYLDRVTENLLNQSTRTQQHIDRAFTLFSQLSSCERHFPIFVLGCEARADAQRAVILDLIARTETRASSRSFTHVKVLLQAIWAQDDLAESEMDYWNKLTRMISCCRIVPSLV
ncbi:fungal-specific transcription factor domain-containing protein [Massariosphaeria phaeospora]|uniref:Fungal-specific transcription factor domain-containing protein n=1 Tax=Massariosphaeria phaeospora TaxID=100035 RepID=A0A7C8I6L4_9PLEO|nr:fungal-specific transcription factor domain-containing protein [Massariosphaeria phaeospora]